MNGTGRDGPPMRDGLRNDGFAAGELVGAEQRELRREPSGAELQLRRGSPGARGDAGDPASLGESAKELGSAWNWREEPRVARGQVQQLHEPMLQLVYSTPGGSTPEMPREQLGRNAFVGAVPIRAPVRVRGKAQLGLYGLDEAGRIDVVRGREGAVEVEHDEPPTTRHSCLRAALVQQRRDPATKDAARPRPCLG